MTLCAARAGGHVTMATTATPPTSTPLDIAVSISATEPAAWEGDLLIVGLFEEALEKKDDKFISADLVALDAKLGGILSEMVTDADFKGKAGTSAVARLGGKARRVGIVGLGPAAKHTPRTFKMAGTAAASAAKMAKAASMGIAIIGASSMDAAAQKKLFEGLSAGLMLGTFEDQRFKSKPKPQTLTKVEALQLPAAAAAGLDKAKAVTAGVLLARQLVNAPANITTPTCLAEVALQTAATFSSRMTTTILEKADCEKLGMGSYLGVAEASDEPPKFIHMKYTPAGEVKRKIAVVGKGLTFDSGGYNIKAGPGSMIEMMKFDMGGAAATLGAAHSVAALAPAGVEVHFVVAACENMIGSRGLRPGDILTASNGKTIEVNNTDAEGRLTLADALLYAQKQGATEVVDIATLTGACMVALGTGIGGLFTPSDDMAASLNGAADAAGEKLWRMPLEDAYWDQMSSPIADMKNTGMGKGGAITAGLFLKEFIDKGVTWAHLDIAGPVWDEKANSATGFGAATLTEWVLSRAD